MLKNKSHYNDADELIRLYSLACDLIILYNFVKLLNYMHSSLKQTFKLTDNSVISAFCTCIYYSVNIESVQID